MNLPTLKIKGKLIAVPNSDQKQEELDNYVPYKYIIKTIEDKLKKTGLQNRFLAIQSRTASGKSTLLPAEIYLHFIHPLVEQGLTNVRGLICTQPRRITAEENVNTIVDSSSPEYSKIFKRGVNIGWSTKYNKYKPKNYGLLSATLGTLLVELQHKTDEEIINKYKFIMIDEVHERSQQLEMLLFILKRFLIRNANNPDCPMIMLLSATFDPVQYAKYYGLDENNVIMCDGATAKITEIYLKEPTSNYIVEAKNIICKIVKDNTSDEREKGDIIVFLPSGRAIKELTKLLKDLPVLVIELTSATQKSPVSTYRLIQAPLEKKYQRRVMLSTNVAETGLTINTLKYVIDSGYNRQTEFDPNYNLDLLLNVPVAKSRMVQRRGRVGRKFDGIFYALYTKQTMLKLKEVNYPEIMLNDVSNLLLSIFAMYDKNNEEFNIEDLDFLQPIPTDVLWSALEKLHMLGFINLLDFEDKTVDYDERTPQRKFVEWYKLVVEEKPSLFLSEVNNEVKMKISELGKIAVSLSELHEVKLEYIRMILSGYYWKVSILDLVRITAFAVVGIHSYKINWSYVYETLSFDLNAIKNRLLVYDTFIDGIYFFHSLETAFSKATDRLSANNILADWCEKAGTQFDTVVTLIQIRDKILDQLLMAGLDIHKYKEYELLSSNLTLQDRIMKIKYCIYDGFRLNLAYLDGTKYKSRQGNLEISLWGIFSDEERAELTNKGVKVNRLLPKVIMYDDVKFSLDKGIPTLIPKRVSSVDGWIHTDV